MECITANPGTALKWVEEIQENILDPDHCLRGASPEQQTHQLMRYMREGYLYKRIGMAFIVSLIGIPCALVWDVGMIVVNLWPFNPDCHQAKNHFKSALKALPKLINDVVQIILMGGIFTIRICYDEVM